MSNKQLTPTSFAILGLLSIQPFTTYELAQQMDRTVSWFWPRAASMLYEEPKKLAAAGLATSQASFTGKRRSTVYQITDAGREALRDWLDAPATGMRMEFAAMLKVAFADAGDASQLRSAVTEILADAEARLAEILDRSTQYAVAGSPFPDRLPIVAITGKLLIGQFRGCRPIGPRRRETRSGNGRVSRRQLVRQYRLTPLLQSGPSRTVSPLVASSRDPPAPRAALASELAWEPDADYLLDAIHQLRQLGLPLDHDRRGTGFRPRGPRTPRARGGCPQRRRQGTPALSARAPRRAEAWPAQRQ